MRGNSLRFGPAGGKLLWAGLVLPVSVGLAIVVVTADFDSTRFVLWDTSPIVGEIGFVAFAIAACWYLVAAVRSGVLASPSGVTIRTTVTSKSYAWSQIRGTRVVEGTPPPQFAVSLGDVGRGLRPDVDSCRAYLVLADRSLVRLPGFESAVKTSGLSGGAPSPTEIKVGALDRYRQSVEAGGNGIA